MTDFEPRIRSLFEPAPVLIGYRSLEDELGAVKNGAKGMSIFWFSRDEVEVGLDEPVEYHSYERVLAVALDLELHVVHRIDKPNTRGEQVYVFVLQHEQMWRIPAYMLSRCPVPPWSDGLEQVHSRILGYSEAQFATWIEGGRWKKAAWGAPTFFALLLASSLPSLTTLGMKAIALDAIADPLRVFDVREDLTVRRDALTRLPADTVLVRFAIEREARSLIEGQTEHSGLRFGNISHANLAALNRALRSAIQILEHDGWK